MSATVGDLVLPSTTLPEVVRPDTGEIVTPPSDRVSITERFRGASTQPVTDDQAAILMAPCELVELDILPTGEVYLSQIGYRRRLNAVFKPAGWSLVPLDKPAMVGATLIQPWALYVKGAFISSAYGEADYHKDNARQSYATAAESLKSNALMRCCKDLGIASECWDRRFTEAFKRDHCVKVYRPKVKVNHESDRFQWRRKDADPFWDEGKDKEPAAAKTTSKVQQPLTDKDIPFGG
jgi:hypothetical protein